MLSVQEIAYRALDTVWSVGYLRSFFVGIRDKYITFSRIIFIIRIGIVEIIIDVLLFCPRHESFSHIHLSCVVALRRFLGGRIGTSWSCERLSRISVIAVVIVLSLAVYISVGSSPFLWCGVYR